VTAETRAIDAVEATARWTAAVRAAEDERPDRLFADPWAAALAGAQGAAWLAGRPPGSTDPIAIRSRYFDDWLRGVAVDGPVRQVVLLAAGLDTRAWRMPWPFGTSLFEVDLGPVLEWKAGVMGEAQAAPSCERREVRADLGEDWPAALVEAGFDDAAPAVWLAEGVLFYLPDELTASILRRVTSLAAPSSVLGFDIPNAAVLTSPYTKAWMDMQAEAGAPWIGTMDDPVAVLDALGWHASVTQPGEPGANFGRWKLPVVPIERRDLPHSWYVTAART
jgi:methyltransferase (TIGR00027 family)